ncbi:flagellar protein FliS [Paenibacillus sp. UNCCL117]|uniref:flagellar export chaperone FliS n=1 Tax=unclassified Paenibacillus TaxID=185978 RepID=UPI00088E2009|nr:MULTISPECIES: flagellar export chaperone FliS [unclassified Paenibacillus]SDE50377.1 flagellar protein FliS [Paenibacillus sp. cl123]SFW67373.1 flagellar protein FliS [Paenibacillus sp. UNCCL117]
MINQPRNKYMETSIQTATPAQLLMMLSDGAIRFCKLAVEALNQRNYEEANLNIGKVQAILGELAATLDHTAPIAEGLLKLYDYFIHRLIEANVKKSPEIAEEVLDFLRELKETWLEAARISKATTPNAAGIQHA